MKKLNKDLKSVKKLTLNKTTIAKLNSKELKSIVGGGNPPDTNPATTKACATSCDTGDSNGCC